MNLENFVCPIGSYNCAKFEGNLRWWVSDLSYMYHFYMELPFTENNGLVVKALDSQPRGSGFKTTGRLQGQLSLSSFRCLSNEYQGLLGTVWLKANCLLIMALQPWNSWTPSIKRCHKVFLKVMSPLKIHRKMRPFSMIIFSNIIKNLNFKKDPKTLAEFSRTCKAIKEKF